jgi:dolichol-phosphate mannosyltransferase
MVVLILAIKSINLSNFFRWIYVGIVFLLLNSGILWLITECLNWTAIQATVFSCIFLTIIRFHVLDKYVFKSVKATLKKFTKYQFVTLLALFSYLAVTSQLIEIGIHYQVSAVIGIVFSTLINFFTNFLIVWNNEK